MDNHEPTFEELQDSLQRVLEARRLAVGTLEDEITHLQSQVKILSTPFEPEIAILREALTAYMTASGLAKLKTFAFTFSVYEQDEWDKAGLLRYAKEQPSVLQFLQKVRRNRLLVR